MAETTYFATLDRSFHDVKLTDGMVDTTQFLEAAEGVVKLFDVFESAAFSVVQSDISGNIKKIRERQLQNPQGCDTLQGIVLSEAIEKKKRATEGMLWLMRGLQFTAAALRRSVENKDEELVTSFTKAYNETLSKHHNFLIKPVFRLAMNACPYRADFYRKLGDPATIEQQLREWLEALELIVKTIQEFLLSGNYTKGM